MASVDVETGNISPQGTVINVGDQFTWTCSQVSPGTSITVYAQSQPWFKTVAQPQVDHIQFAAPGPSNAVIAELASPPTGWKWTATGANVNSNAHVNVGVHMPAERKKAS